MSNVDAILSQWTISYRRTLDGLKREYGVYKYVDKYIIIRDKGQMSNVDAVLSHRTISYRRALDRLKREYAMYKYLDKYIIIRDKTK